MNSVGNGFIEHDSRIEYFVKFDTIQNFGDYLPELFSKELFLYPRVDADIYRLVGSVIDEKWIRHDLGQVNGYRRGLIAFWCCGARDDKPISPEALDNCQFFGVRGPGTRDLLGLPQDTVLGDPGLLAPLLHSPKPHSLTSGKSVCIAHVHDTREKSELLELAGTETIISPVINAGERELREIFDKIASADFVLTASLHGAIIACAYGTPFAFWDNGHLDCPFKWEDFAASVEMPALFATNLAEGRHLYETEMKPRINIPPLTPILDACPFMVHPAKLIQAHAHDCGRTDMEPAEIERFLEGLPSYQLPEIHRLQAISREVRESHRNPITVTEGSIGLALRKYKRLATERVRRARRS